VRYVVFHAGSFVGAAVIEIGVQQMARPTADVEFPGARVQRDVHGLGVLALDAARLVLHIRAASIMAISRKRPAMPEKNNENENESQRANRRTEGSSGAPRVRILAPLRGIPHRAQPNED